MLNELLSLHELLLRQADREKRKRKEYATYAVALYMGDKCVKDCPPGALRAL